MEAAIDLKYPVAAALTATLFLLAAGQSLHMLLALMKRDPRPSRMLAVYEALILCHLVFACMVAYSAFQSIDVPYLRIRIIQAPLEPALWANAAACALGCALLSKTRHPLRAIELVLLAASTPPAMHAAGAFWGIILIIDTAYFLFRVSSDLILDTQHHASTVSRLSVIEAIDTLPEGILCASKQGRVLLMNDSMRACLSALGFPTDLADTRGLWATLQRKAAFGEAPDALLPEGVRLRISDTETRLFAIDEVILRKNRCQRIIAFDVTEEEKLNATLERTNQLLEKANEDLRRSMDDIQTIAENQALLRMRSRVHDIAGQRLSILHRYLEDGDSSDETLSRIASMLNTVLDDLAVYESLDHNADLEAIAIAFSLINIEVKVQGDLPCNEAVAGVFVRTIREATTNAAKHAQASHVTARIEKDERGFHLSVENDGEPPTGRIREGAGLVGIRLSVREVGGQLTVQTEAPFTLHIDIPYEGESL